MSSVAPWRRWLQVSLLWTTVGLGLVLVAVMDAPHAWPAVPEESSPANPDAEATIESEMKPYSEPIRGTDVTFEMVPIPAGTFLMGSPEGEAGRRDDEGPRHPVRVSAFWMGKHEVTWSQYELWAYRLEQKFRKAHKVPATPMDTLADAVTRPTPPYTDMTFGMGHDGYPAICMTQLAAKVYCQWLSAKTGHYYRLPTEAEWEYACRAGTTTAYSFGDEPAKLDEYGWYFDNCNDKYQKVGQKKPNPWGLYDMHGNVAEWCLDQYDPDAYSRFPTDQPTPDPYVEPSTLYPRVVRGGSWDDFAEDCRSAARRGSTKDWKMQDPQIPQSQWYHTDAIFVGFRVIRPLNEPSEAEKAQYGPDKIQTESD